MIDMKQPRQNFFIRTILENVFHPPNFIELCMDMHGGH